MNPGRQTQKGAALLLAMVILTLVSTLAAGMIWQQWRAVQVETAERTRAQATWILTGLMDFGRVILRLDARTPGVDNLTEPWATDLREDSLSNLLAQDRNNSAEGAPEAFLKGGIRDAQSRYNLRNLVDASNQVVEAELAALRRLCESASLPADTADTLALGLQSVWNQAPSGAEGTAPATANPPLVPQQVGQLTWLGLDAATVKSLQPFVVLLPEPTPLNINTASREVLAGVVPGLDASSAELIVSKRPFKSLEEARAYILGESGLDSKRLSVGSKYFEISGQLRMEGRVIEERLLVMRREREMVPISRSRQSLQAAPS